MRLFIAINFNNETLLRLLGLRDELSSRSDRGNYSQPENLHLTLVFLGECNEKQSATAKSAMNAVAFDPFDLTVDCIGRFKRNGGDIWWAGINKSKSLLDLQRTLEEKLIAEGFSIEKREYKPHVTLGREIVTSATPWQIESFGEAVHKIDLMKSENISGKLTYTSIHRRGKWEKPIIIEPHNPKWQAEFERIRTFLTPLIGDLIVDIHHVGSTSVPGLSAKPIIDFDIEIASMDVFSAIKERLAKLGFRHEGDYGITGREAFKRETNDDFMAYHMYVCPSDSLEFKRHIKFRDALRVNATAVSEYGTLKTTLAAKHGNDIDAYIDGKADYIRKNLRS